MKCFKINKLISICKFNENILAIYNKTEIVTAHKNITQISSIPPEIGQLYNLQKLDLSYNLTTQIPPEIGQLNNLRKLYLYNNQITQIPRLP